MHSPHRDIFALASLLLTLGIPGQAQRAAGQASHPRGLEIRGVPALNFDSDEGFGYGAIVELYHYGDGTVAPYAWTLQPTVFLTTKGRRDFTVFFDTPGLLPPGWRLDAFVGSEKQVATPYYGVGNSTLYDDRLDADDGPDPYYYRFGRARVSAVGNLQRRLGDLPLRALAGLGVTRTRIDPFPEDEGTTLYAMERGDEEVAEWTNHLRVGLVWDTRDRESGPSRGAWTELLVQRVDERLGSEVTFTRWTVTDRRYVQLGDRIVLANRYVLQHIDGRAPIHELFRVQTSFKQQEGLGGSKTVRGVLKNRFVGKGLFIWNLELRVHAADFTLAGRSFHAVISAFVDRGRVWEDGLRMSEAFRGLHTGFGGGARVGMGENFVVGLDGGTSDETGLQVYIGLGYLY